MNFTTKAGLLEGWYLKQEFLLLWDPQNVQSIPKIIKILNTNPVYLHILDPGLCRAIAQSGGAGLNCPCYTDY
jgi:hypothetical protein